VAERRRVGRFVHLVGDQLGAAARLRDHHSRRFTRGRPDTHRPGRAAACRVAVLRLRRTRSRCRGSLRMPERSGSPRSTSPSPASSPTTGPTPRTSATSPPSTGTPCRRWTSSAAGFPARTYRPSGRWPALKPGTRSGLWAHMAAAIDALQPDWVVIENVRGLLSAPAIRANFEGDPR
jgi:hypothetical protein